MADNDSFAAFYAEYPRKVARKAAEKAWARAATSPEVIEQIMAGLRAQLPRYENMRRSGDKSFIPHASTWLNGHRWEDERSAPIDPRRRVIACEKCGDTGVLYDETWGDVNYSRCSCPIGQLPGVLAGVAE